MARVRRGRVSLREHKKQVNAALAFYGVPLRNEIKPKRVQRPQGSNGRPLERNVLKAVIKALREDDRVARVERNMAGMFEDGGHKISVGPRGKLDLTVYLKDGRYLEIEVKREPDVKLLSDAQKHRIKSIRAAGGLAGWCWNVPSAIALLPQT